MKTEDGSRMKRKRILVIDNDKEMLRLIEIVLNKDYDVQTCDHGEEGRFLVRATSPDLVILDMQLGAIWGGDIYQALRSDPEMTRIPVIICTVHGNATIRRKLGAEPDFQIQKPFNVLGIRALVERALGFPSR